MFDKLEVNSLNMDMAMMRLIEDMKNGRATAIIFDPKMPIKAQKEFSERLDQTIRKLRNKER